MSIRNILDKTKDLLNTTIGQTASELYYILDSFYNRPIGLANVRGTNYKAMLMHLNRNIGNIAENSNDKAYTPIGRLADFDYNSSRTPWFLLDQEKKKYYDYISYISDVYYDGTKDIISLPNNGIKKIDFLNPEAANPAVIHGISNWTIPDVFSENYLTKSVVNGNNYGNYGNDTRLGVLSNYYLIKTLEGAADYHKYLGYSTAQNQSDDVKT